MHHTIIIDCLRIGSKAEMLAGNGLIIAHHPPEATYEVVETDGPQDRDECRQALVPEIESLMQRDDCRRRLRFVFEARLTKRDDASVFAAVEPRPESARR